MSTTRTVLGTVIGLALCALANADDMAVRVAFHVRSQPMARALMDLGDQAGLQLLVRREDLEPTKISRPIQGDLTVPAALDQLLAGTGLTYDFIDARTVRVKMATGEVDRP